MLATHRLSTTWKEDGLTTSMNARALVPDRVLDRAPAGYVARENSCHGTGAS